MCGRFARYSDVSLLASLMGLDAPVAEHARSGRARYNIAPTAPVWVFHRLGADRATGADQVHWGYRPAWALHNPKLPRVHNADFQSAPRKPYYADMWRAGCRVIVPADGWYEWTELDGCQTPFLISRPDGPCYFAGLTNWRPDGATLPPGHGLVLLTDDAAGGVVAPDSRRPVVLAAEDALTWLDPLSTPHSAAELLASERLDTARFQWWPVSRDVGRATVDHAELIRPRQQPIRWPNA